MGQLFGTTIDTQRPTSTGGHLFSAPIITSDYNPTSTPAPIKIAPSATNISQKSNLLNSAINTVKKIGKDISLSFTAPKISPKLPDSAFQQPQKVEPSKPISITPNQKKLTTTQLKTVAGNFVGKVVNKIDSAEQSVFGIKLGTIGENLSELGAILSGNTLPGMKEEYDKLDPWSKLNEATKIFGMLPTMQGFKALEGAKDVASAVRGLIVGYGAGSLLNYASQEPKKRSIGEAIKPSFDNMVFAYFTGSTGLPNPFEALKSEPNISKADYIKSRDFLKSLGVKEEVFSKPEALKKSYFNLARKYHPDLPSGNVNIFKQINSAYKIVTDTFYDVVKTGDKSPIAGLLTDGEHTPQEVIGQVIKNNLEKTPEGKGLIKAASEAQQKGQNIVVSKTQPPVQGGVDTLIQEASKYKSAKEFYLRINDNTRDLLRNKGIRGEEALTEFWNKNAIKSEPILDTLNPTGSLYADYNPQSRMTMKLGKNITTYDKTANLKPDEMVTIYRGASKNHKTINPGDFITTKRELAESYTGDKNILELKVKAKDILDDINEPLGDEYIYRPKSKTVVQGGVGDYSPQIPTKIISPTIEKLKGESIDQAIARKIGYQIDNGVVKLEDTPDGWKATILQGDNPQIIRGVKKQQVLNEVYKNLNPDYGAVEGGKTTPPLSPTVPKVSRGEVVVKPVEAPKSVPQQEVETPVSKEIDEFVKELDRKHLQEGFVSLEGLKKPDLEGLKKFIKKIGTREEQIGEDAFWQQQLFQAKRETNIRNITKEVQEKFAPELMVNLLDKIPYVDKDAAIRITRSIQRLNFVKERNRQKLLYKSASAIAGLDVNGNPVFGTKIQKVLDDGMIKEDWRYTPEEAKLLWNKLTIQERRILKDYMLPIEKAKSIFSRELLKQKAGIEKGVEGYIHKYYEDKIGDRFKKLFFKFRRAAPTKTRTRFVNPETGKVEELKGNVENFEKSVIKQMENITNTEEYNKFIQIWQDLLTEPLNDKNPLKKGWVEVRGTLKTGIPTDKPRIFKTEEGYGIAPQVRRQTPIVIKDMYMKEMGEIGESYAIVNGVRSLARFWQGNVLIYPGTVATNAISGGLQYGTKIINDFFKDGVLSGNFKPFIFDIVSLIDALRPSVIEKLRPELIGAKVNIATQFGKPTNFVDKFLEIGLTPFGMVETYWKRVISDATLRGIGKKPEDILLEFETFKKVAKESDIYGYNYSNIPLALEKWRGSWYGAMIYPFITYPYKYARFLERYTLGAVKEVFTGNKKDGFAKLLTLASIISILYFFQHKKEEKVGEYVDEMKYPGEFDKTGRIKIGETSEKENYLRVIKYPWLNFMKILQAGADILKGDKEKGLKEISGIGQEFVSEGPLLNITNLLLGYRDKFSLYKSDSVIFGEITKSFIPAFRINESISMLINPEKTKQDTFKQAIERVLYMKPSGEVKTGFSGKELQYNREEEFLKFAFGINIRSIDRAEYEQAKNQAIQNMVNRLDDEDILPKSRERAIEVLKIFGVEENEYNTYLDLRKKRMSESRKKSKFKIKQ